MQEKRLKRADRLQLMLTHDEIKLVDHWRFDHRMPSRSAAVRALLRLGFDNSRAVPRDGDVLIGVASADVGILSSDRKVDRAIGVAARQRPVLITGNDMLVAHAASSLLNGVGVPLEGPHDAPEAIRQALRDRRPRLAIVAVDPSAEGLDGVIAELKAFNGTKVVLAPEAKIDGDLASALGNPVVVGIPDVLDRLAGIVGGLLDTASASRA